MAGVVLHQEIPDLGDSKKLSEAKRVKLFDVILESSLHHIVITENDQIDSEGLSASLRHGVESICSHIQADTYLFDGNQTFGVANIITQVKADADVPAVSAASILAKVTRDRLMIEWAAKYPDYGFEKHKGYGTKSHLEAIAKCGLCPLHRKSYRINPSLFQ